jgi:APA family basic amino acid/polyamine antiporter
MNLPAFVIVLVVISILLRGTKGAAKANNFIVMLKVSAIIFVIVAGAFFIDPVNWTPFIPAQTVITENGVSKCIWLLVLLLVLLLFSLLM